MRLPYCLATCSSCFSCSVPSRLLTVDGVVRESRCQQIRPCGSEAVELGKECRRRSSARCLLCYIGTARYCTVVVVDFVLLLMVLNMETLEKLGTSRVFKRMGCLSKTQKE